MESLESRSSLYRVLSGTARVRLLALAEYSELSLGEIGESLNESQPNVSKYVKALRTMGLVSERREGTRRYVRLAQHALADPVVADALCAGRLACTEDGTFERVQHVIDRRDRETESFFDTHHAPATDWPPALEMVTLALMLNQTRKKLAVDAGSGSGLLSSTLAAAFDNVLAFDRSATQVKKTETHTRPHQNVHVLKAAIGDPSIEAYCRKHGGADSFFMSRLLHHHAQPERALRTVRAMMADGGGLYIVDYAAHEDESMREKSRRPLARFFRSGALPSFG